MTSHENFDLEVSLRDEVYTSRVLYSPMGELQRPSTGLRELMASPDMRSIMGKLAGNSIKPSQLQDLGTRLFGALFPGDIEVQLLRSLDDVQRSDSRLRLRLRTDSATEQLGIPWEILYWPRLGDYISLQLNMPMCRYADQPRPSKVRDLQLPIRILAVVSAPEDVPGLDVEREWRLLDASLERLVLENKAEVFRLDAPTLRRLDASLRENHYDVIHFSGHGDLDAATGAPVLFLESPDRSTDAIGTQAFARLLRGNTSVKVVFLNSCLGALEGLEGRPPNFVDSLMAEGVPAVLAMRERISDEAAIEFSREFYRALAVASPIDVAVAHARRQMALHLSTPEWAIPTLGLRSQDGMLLGLPDERNGVDELRGRASLRGSRGSREAGVLRSELGTDGGTSLGTLDYLRTSWLPIFLTALIVTLVFLQPMVAVLEGSGEAARSRYYIPVFDQGFAFRGFEVLAFIVIGGVAAILGRYLTARAMSGLFMGGGMGAAVAIINASEENSVPMTILGWLAGMLTIEATILTGRWFLRFRRRRHRIRRRI